jgi:hypothetical protein
MGTATARRPALLSLAECRVADRDEWEDEPDSAHHEQILGLGDCQAPRSVPALANQCTGPSISRSLLVAMAWSGNSHGSAETVKNGKWGGRSSWGGSIPSTGRGNWRGWQVTGEHGVYRFWSVLPTRYPIPDDGPVGELIAAAGRGPMRPAHLNLKGHHPRSADAEHARVRGRRRVPAQRRRLRGEGQPHRRVHRTPARHRTGQQHHSAVDTRFDLVLAAREEQP